MIKPQLQPLNTLRVFLVPAMLFCAAGLSLPDVARAQTTNVALPSFDFTTAQGAQGWSPTHDVNQLWLTSTGVLVRISGSDPYLTGPPRNYPDNLPLWATMRIYSDHGGGGQLFFFDTAPTESRSVRFTVPARQWARIRAPLPSLGKDYRFRIDPPGAAGTATISALSFEERRALPDFDFTSLPDASEWTAAHDIRSLTPTDPGLLVEIGGSDPYLFGPARNYPENKLLWLHLRLKSGAGGMAQIFYFNSGPAEENSIKFYVPPGRSHEAVVPVPALGPGWRLRIDPPGDEGTCLLERLWFEERTLLQPPAWPVPSTPVPGNDPVQLTSGELTLRHSRNAFGSFELIVSGKPFAAGHDRPLIGYMDGAVQGWLPVNGPSNQVKVVSSATQLMIDCRIPAGNGVLWTIQQTFSSARTNSIEVETRITADRDQTLVYFPAFTLLPGLGSFGTNKSQAVFCGLEYLENEPSSSEADITGVESRRQVPASDKITMPLMALAAQGSYVGLSWEPHPDVAAVFDSPDRLFGSSSHLFGLLLPGSDGENRREGDLLPYKGLPLAANRERVVKATILGGRGTSIIPALQQHLTLKGLPELPSSVLSSNEYYALAARGWLDSRIRTNGLVRHAYWPGFGPTRAADAAVWMQYLRQVTPDEHLQNRLAAAAQLVIEEVPEPSYLDYSVGHVSYPALPSLVFGAVSANALSAQSKAASMLSRFENDGSITYKPVAAGVDYGRTHYAPDANGLTATHLASFLELATFAGDRSLISTGLHLLNALGKFRDTVPRGAQTWEVPLHTPDILASARLLRCYTLGYELTGDPAWLDQARYWAWTGIPFIYLTPPPPGPVGVYATIPVFGATTWVGSWFGVPVQWCGLVYADALNRFAKYDPEFPWRKIADGIALSGVQQSWGPEDAERLGLLPDFFMLRQQVSAGPAINPATLQAAAVGAYGGPRPFDFRSLPWHGLQVYAAGEIGAATETRDRVSFTVTNWLDGPCSILINGISNAPVLKIDGVQTALGFPHLFQPTAGRLVLRVQGTVSIEFITPAQPRLEIRHSTTNAGVNLFWPAAAGTYALEFSPAFAPGAAWQISSREPRRLGETLVANETATQGARFFRLRDKNGTK